MREQKRYFLFKRTAYGSRFKSDVIFYPAVTFIITDSHVAIPNSSGTCCCCERQTLFLTFSLAFGHPWNDPAMRNCIIKFNSDVKINRVNYLFNLFMIFYLYV